MADSDSIFVDLDQLRLACDAVDMQILGGLQTGFADAATKMQHGVRFGLCSPSGEADAAGKALRAALRRHAENSQQHVVSAEQLAVTLNLIIVNYTDADAIAKLDIEAMEAMLTNAIPLSLPSPAPFGGGPLQ